MPAAMPAAIVAALLSLASLFGVGPPYQTSAVPGATLSHRTIVTGCIMADVDGDGVRDVATGVTTGILFLGVRDGTVRALQQVNLPPRLVEDGARVTLGAGADLDRDGQEELVLTAATADGWDQRLLVVEPLGEGVVRDFALPAGPDARPDGVWDGRHDVLAVADVGGRRLAVLTRRMDFDRLTRAVTARDLETGEEVWSYAVAGNAARHALGDLDGDGRDELVVGVGSGDNLRAGEEVRGRRDDTAWVLALRTDGSLLWERQVGGRFGDPLPAVADLDGDGRVEVVVHPRCHAPEAANVLFVLAGETGQELAARPTTGPAAGLCAWDAGADGPGGIVLVTTDGRAERLAWGRGGLRSVAGRDLGTAVNGLLARDFLPAPGPELAFFLGGSDLVLLDADLHTLADMPAGKPARGTAGIWDLGADSIVLYGNVTGFGQRFVPVPVHRRYAGPVGAGAVLLGLGTVGGTLLRQRRRLRRLRRTSRRDLLHAFLTARHGTVGPVGVLERVMWAVDNPAPDGTSRLAEAWAEARREAMPDLEALLEKAVHVRLDPPLLAIVRRELGRLARTLDELAGAAADDRRRAGLVAAARTSLGLVADGVKSLGTTLAEASRLDPLPLVRELVQRHAERRAAVAFDLEIAPDAAGWLVHADLRHLEFALDNLLDNAGRHAVPGSSPRVATGVVLRGDRLVISVADNGPGIAPADRGRIFVHGVSSKPGGGGLGLAHSREAMRYYGGDLVCDEAPGGGARFTVILRAAPA